MMDPRELEGSVFNTARRLSATERAAYLDEACAGDAALRQRVEELLDAGVQAADFLENPAPGLDVIPAATLPSGSRATLLSPHMPREAPGDRIGRYKLLQQIGEGGCGVVYMAEQQEPVRRQVALKVIKLGMDTKNVIARFEAERQALALMDHPNIAKVLDAGTTEAGRPYFVMELIRGAKLTDFCDENKVPTEERLKLFIRVCQAIQHAHQKGIIHRDIKPSNVLVTLNDGVPVPKVIDFGIAKATQGRLTDQTLFTAFEQFIGTPAYMSPEQAVVTSLDIDTRSDIYSLGVLLYELLTGRPPFDQKELLASGLDEMRRTIREKEPPKPSTRLNSLAREELTTAAQRRRTEAPRLIHLVKGDLDWVVMKCLEKDRTRRYETANGLAVDIQRHLDNEPIAARPPSRLYRLGKAIRRNQSAFVSGLAITATLLIGTVVSTWQAVRATRAEREQNRLRIQAEAGRAAEAAARQTAEARELIVKAKVASDAGNLEEAGKVLARIPPAAFQPDLEHARLRRHLGTQHAIRGQWNAAAADFSVLRQVNATDSALERNLDLLRVGPVLIELGDTNQYHQFVEETITQWSGASDPVTCERICKACLTAPADEATLKRLAPFYEASARGVDNLGDTGERRWASTSLALFEYRRGNYAKAIEWSTVAVERYSGGTPGYLAIGHLLRAMAAHPLHLETGLEDLNLARAAISDGLKKLSNPTPEDLATFEFIPAFDWLLARILLREAEDAYRSPRE
jgi:serine/threonine protein kinase